MSVILTPFQIIISALFLTFCTFATGFFTWAILLYKWPSVPRKVAP